MQLKINGHDVYVATGNRVPNPQKPTVVFLHGTGQDHSIWVLPTRYFARHDRNVLAVDLPGHGRSGGEPLKTIEAMADWAVRLLDAAGLSKAAIVGHSMGSLVAIAVAARHPERVRSLWMTPGRARSISRTPPPSIQLPGVALPPSCADLLKPQ